ncbi:oleosin [Striga asiatica]|uniref:Oleosin n=1 Tax=Striga asiatica TaxID=4170 RepID=A0A5A7PW27_STRAF|nr:oleosin [Striga asiatica]
MADRDRDRDRHIQSHPHSRYETTRDQLLPHKGGGGPSAQQILAIAALLPVGGSLLGLAGIILAGTLVGLAVATPLFVIFSPILIPAAILIAGSVAGFLTSGAFGLTGLSSFSWLLNSFRRATGQEPIDYARRQLQEGIVQVGEKTKQVGEMVGDKTRQTGEAIKSKAAEGGGTREGAAGRT